MTDVTTPDPTITYTPTDPAVHSSESEFQSLYLSVLGIPTWFHHMVSGLGVIFDKDFENAVIWVDRKYEHLLMFLGFKKIQTFMITVPVQKPVAAPKTDTTKAA